MLVVLRVKKDPLSEQAGDLVFIAVRWIGLFLKGEIGCYLHINLLCSGKYIPNIGR